MKRTTISLLVAAGVSLAPLAGAETGMPAPNAPPLSQESYDAAKANAEAQYKLDDAACDSLSGNTKDVCTVTAKAQRNVSIAEAEAAHENTPKYRQAARLARADAHYDIAVERCDDLAGNGKAVCEAEAKAALVSAKADASVDRVNADTRLEGADKRSEARTDANADKADAEYDVAIEKCGVLAGTPKDDCVSAAKMQFDKS